MAPSDADEEKPLDPAVARVQVKLRRLLLISGLTLGLGLLAVFFAILYRITTVADKAGPASTAPKVRIEQAALPPGSRLVSSNLASDRVVLTYETASGTLILVVRLSDMALVGRLDLTKSTEPP